KLTPGLIDSSVERLVTTSSTKPALSTGLAATSVAGDARQRRPMAHAAALARLPDAAEETEKRGERGAHTSPWLPAERLSRASVVALVFLLGLADDLHAIDHGDQRFVI